MESDNIFEKTSLGSKSRHDHSSIEFIPFHLSRQAAWLPAPQ